MKKVLLFSLLLLGGGLAGSWLLPAIFSWQQHAGIAEVIRWLSRLCLSFILIHVGYEFDLDKSRLGQYAVDDGVAATAAGFPLWRLRQRVRAHLQGRARESRAPSLWLHSELGSREDRYAFVTHGAASASPTHPEHGRREPRWPGITTSVTRTACSTTFRPRSPSSTMEPLARRSAHSSLCLSAFTSWPAICHDILHFPARNFAILPAPARHDFRNRK